MGGTVFLRVGVKNFRTHTDTTLEPGAVTLLFGSNSAGKSNLLAAIRHFSLLAALGRPSRQSTQPAQADEDDIPDVEEEKSDIKRVREGNFFPHRHRLAPDDTPISFACLWKHDLGEVEYEIELYEAQSQGVCCREKIRFSALSGSGSREVKSGWDRKTNELALRSRLQSERLSEKENTLTSRFFRDLASCYLYHFQPSFLKGKTTSDSARVDQDRLRIASQLGYEGGNLQRILRLVQEREERTFNAFLASLHRFDSTFRTISYNPKRDQTLWLFDLGRSPARLDEFSPDVVSDGFLRAAAIALLTSMRNPPALILLEEIENGISQRNIGSFLQWLQQAAGTPKSSERGFATQFVVTSHSPSVLREFSDHLDDVFHLRLERRGHKSVVRNLNSALLAFVDMGTVEAEEEFQRDGKKVIKIAPDKLTELWYSGVIGAEAE